MNSSALPCRRYALRTPMRSPPLMCGGWKHSDCRKAVPHTSAAVPPFDHAAGLRLDITKANGNPMLETLRQRLQAHAPRRLDLGMPQAAVLLPIVDRPEPTLLFTRRAAHLSTHGGQVAFPGGKRDKSDADLLATALRESHEEIALPPERVELFGQLSDVISLHGLQVTPYVGRIPPDLPLVPEL